MNLDFDAIVKDILEKIRLERERKGRKVRSFKSSQKDTELPEKPETGKFIEEYGKLGK